MTCIHIDVFFIQRIPDTPRGHLRMPHTNAVVIELWHWHLGTRGFSFRKTSQVQLMVRALSAWQVLVYASFFANLTKKDKKRKDTLMMVTSMIRHFSKWKNCHIAQICKNKPPEVKLEAFTLVLAFQTGSSGSNLMAKGYLKKKKRERKSCSINVYSIYIFYFFAYDFFPMASEKIC